jgi:hypothetical protein
MGSEWLKPTAQIVSRFSGSLPGKKNLLHRRFSGKLVENVKL